MCDEHTAQDNDQYLSRRQFGAGLGAMGGAVGVAMLLPSPANAATVVGKAVSIKTPDGVADCWFVAPTAGKHPAVLVWPDIMGLRPAFQQMGKRLAESGYAVLVVNQFYRSTKAPFLKPGESFDQPEVRAKIMPWRTPLTTAATQRDAHAFVDFLDAQKSVDKSKGMASTGYCMGGPMTMIAAALRPDRIRAGVTFHGGGLVTDKPDSPHLMVPKMKAAYLFAIAENDDAREPTAKDALRTAFAVAKLPAEIEVYKGTIHGWCPPDSKVYNAAQADRAWARMLALFEKSLV